MTPEAKVESGIGVAGKHVVIRERWATAFGCWLYDKGDTGALWATSPSPRRLAELAFECGALSVRHEYSLVAEHARFHGQ